MKNSYGLAAKTIEPCAAFGPRAPSGSPVFSKQNASARLIRCAGLNRTLAAKSLTMMSLATMTLLVGCARYSTVSPDAYEYTKALYSVCNRHDEPRLTSVARQIDSARAEAQLTSTEADWLDDIVLTAQAGDWQDATREARRLMEAQVEGR